MVGSELLYRPIYTAAWKHAGRTNRQTPLAFYCPEEIDLLGFEQVAKHLPPITYISSNHKVSGKLQQAGLSCKGLFSFPKVLIMSRHSLHRFPSDEILAIGMRHGPYHFKRMTKAENYNRFSLYLFSSQADLEAARAIGVRVGQAVGFPRLDPAFDGSITQNHLKVLSRRLALDPSKPTMLFTATWDASGMSAIDLWFRHLADLSKRWNILVTLHPWISSKYRKALRHIEGARLVAPADLLKAIMLANVCVGDQSSILAECCALDKGIVTFETNPAARALPEIDELLKNISVRIYRYSELEQACQLFLDEPSLLQEQRQSANLLMFDALDGQAGKLAADAILKHLSDRGISCS